MMNSLGNITNNILKMNGLRSTDHKPVEPQADPKSQFIHPILTTQGFKETIKNYNKHISVYNMKVRAKNSEVDSYNKLVIKNRRDNPATRQQQVDEFFWKDERKAMEPEQYNYHVELYNRENGYQLRKKRLAQEVKPDTEKYFIAFLHHYNMQLYKRKAMRIKYDVSVPGELPKLDLYPNKIVENKKDGAEHLPVSKETVAHHRQRMIEAGVLHSYQFRGPNRPVKVAINEDILAITDNKKPQKATTDNQQVKREITNKVHHNNVSSRKNTLENSKYRRKGDATASDYNATEKGTKEPGGNVNHASKGQNQFSKISGVLAASLEEKGKLARDLSANKHAEYKPLDLKITQTEAYYGTMHPDDFKELAIQDIFKFSNSLFTHLHVHPGSWTNAIKLWQAEKFMNFTKKTFTKPKVLEEWQKMLTVLREIKKYKQNNSEWTPRYPSIYFDPAQKFKENNGFEYALNYFRVDQVDVKPRFDRNKNARKDLQKKTDVKKAIEKIRLFLRDKIELQELYDYVNYNCNRQVMANLHDLINKEMQTYNPIN